LTTHFSTLQPLKNSSVDPSVDRGLWSTHQDEPDGLRPVACDRDSQSAVRTLQDRFLSNPGQTDLSSLRPVIARSWRRSLMCNVDPGMAAVEARAEPRLDEQVLRCAEPVLSYLEHLCADTNGCVSLSDPSGTTAVFRGAPSVVRWAETRFPILGGCMTEERAGTNSDGTALEEGVAVQVWGSEHYIEAMKDTCCTSVPIRDPLRQSVRGILALSLPARIALDSDPRSIALIVYGAAAEVTRALEARLAAREQALLSAYLREVRKRGTIAVVAMDERTTIASRRAMQLLDQSDYAVLAGYAREAEELRRPVDFRMTAVSGQHLCLNASPVGAGEEVAGVVMRLRAPSPVASASRHSAGGRQDPFSTVVGESPALRRVVEVANTACDRGTPLWIVGEAGTGKRHLAEAVAARMWDVTATIDCGASDAASPAVGDRVREELGHGHAVVLHHVDALAPLLREQLLDVITSAERPKVVLTALKLTDETMRVVSDLQFVDVAMPPLRLRREDIPLLVSHFLAGLRPGPMRASSRLLQVLVEADWQGNVRQLKHVVENAASRVTGDEVGLCDLTDAQRRGLARCRLSRLEEVELQQIREALAEARGNRVQAAALLQIGRSTLYRRIEMYERRGFDVGMPGAI